MDYASNRMDAQWTAARPPTLNEIRDQAATVLKDYPLAVVLATFGAGLAVGAAVGMIMAEVALPAPRPDTLTQKTLDALSQVLPASVMRKIRG